METLIHYIAELEERINISEELIKYNNSEEEDYYDDELELDKQKIDEQKQTLAWLRELRLYKLASEKIINSIEKYSACENDCIFANTKCLRQEDVLDIVTKYLDLTNKELIEEEQLN